MADWILTCGQLLWVRHDLSGSKIRCFLNSQWLLSRVISAQKANTALGLSTTGATGFALSTANLYSAVQPGGSLYGLQLSNPVDPSLAYNGNSNLFGTAWGDPMVGNKIGGVNVFGGGLALYDANHNLVGGLGVSGDTSCTDHNVAWRVREAVTAGAFSSINVPADVNGSPYASGKDNIIYLNAGEAPNGFKHPNCGNHEKAVNQALVP